VIRRGLAWERDRATVGYVPDGTRPFYVDQDDDVVFLEQPADPRTWSELVARRATRR
jgi:hypothetical protein